MIIHVVSGSDSVYKLAQRYGVTTQSIINANQLLNPNQLAIGQALVIPDDNIEYRVVQGDSIYTIARKYDTTIERIAAANPQIQNINRIYPGQIVRIPGGTMKRSIDVNGYAFPSIGDAALMAALPNLTFISIFSYEVRADGSLNRITDNSLITAARSQNVAPMMVITNIAESGGFNSELASTILNNNEIQNTLVNNAVRIMNEKNYSGLDIDFEYVYPKDRENYNAFLRKVAARIKPLGYILTTAIAPKISADQPGLLYEAHDYKVHGEVSDHVIIMTYEWGYTYGPAMAVSPINEVERVLRYAVTAIPSRKILMGMPNYGYDWTLPYVRGSAARSLSNLSAVRLAIQKGAEIQYDELAQAPYFYYYDTDGKQHEVWFDDARSISARLKLVEKYNLGGVSYWTINTLFRQNWIVLSSMYNINKILP